jgi:hypothetical protein
MEGSCHLPPIPGFSLDRYRLTTHVFEHFTSGRSVNGMDDDDSDEGLLAVPVRV